MQIRRTAVLALALCLALFSDSVLSQRRSQQSEIKQPKTTVTQPKSAEEQRGTDQAPFIIKIAPTPKSEQERTDEAKDRERIAQSDRNKEKSDADIVKYTGQLALFTERLFFATVALFIATVGLLIAGERQLRLARAEFLSTHRPKIRIKHLWLGNDIWHGEPIIINLVAVNHGTTEAILAEIGIKYFVVKEGRFLPIEPAIPAIFNFSGGKLPCGLNWETKGINTNRILTPEENADIQEGRSKLYCVGFLSYLDASGRMRITGFCRVLTFPQDALAHIGNCRFRVFDDPDYEYED